MPVLVLAAFWQWILALHIVAVIVAFGVLFVYPLVGLIGVRLEPQAMPSVRRLERAIHLRVQAPGLVLVILAGIYLASYLHDWSDFFVGWGLAASIVIGGIGGAYIAPREARLAELAETQLAAAPAGGAAFSWSGEYVSTARQVDLARRLQLAIAVVTILFMALQLR